MELGLVTAAGIKVIADLLKDQITHWLDSRSEKTPADVHSAIDDHLAEVNQWSARIQFYGMSSAQSIETSIPLDLETPRQFSGERSSSITHEETDLLRDNDHLLILGAPGAGKTTILKRLSRRLLSEPPAWGEIAYQFPIVVRLRELSGTHSLYGELTRILGLSAAVTETPVTDDKEEPKDDEENKKTPTVKMLGRLLVPVAMHQILNKGNALLLIDGLDELDIAYQARIHSELEALARGLISCKMIVTCRSGSFEGHLDGFDVLEVKSLTPQQILEIASHWLKDSAQSFIQSLEAVPYRDMADRPLLLAQLMLVFDDDGSLPHQPADVYKRMLTLLLERWDKERDIKRGSKYSAFSPDRKEKFLAALAYHLTVRIRTKVFSEKTLVDAYTQIHKQFSLPSAEGHAVAKEIESHNGLIIQGSRTKYEFSHLSFQEFLCAEYLVCDSFPERLADYLTHYPGPVAIAVTISSNPTNWLGALFLRTNIFKNFTTASLREFIRRLLIERPIFERSVILGFVVTIMFWIYRDDELAQLLVEAFVSMEEVYASLGLALERHYSAVGLTRGSVRLKLTTEFQSNYGLKAQKNILLPRKFLENVLDDLHIQLHCRPLWSEAWISTSGGTLSDLPELDPFMPLP